MCKSADIPVVYPENKPTNATVRWLSSDSKIVSEEDSLTPDAQSGIYYCSFFNDTCESALATVNVNIVESPTPIINNSKFSKLNQTCIFYEFDMPNRVYGSIEASCDGVYNRMIWNMPDGTQSYGNTIDVWTENIIDYKHIVSVFTEYDQDGITCQSDLAYDISFVQLKPPKIQAPQFYPAGHELKLKAQFDSSDIYPYSYKWKSIEWEEANGVISVSDSLVISYPQGKYTFIAREWDIAQSCHSDKISFDIVFGNGYPILKKTDYQVVLGEPNPKMEVILLPETSVQWRDSSGTVVSTEAYFTSDETNTGKFDYFIYFSTDSVIFKPLGKVQLGISKWITGYAYNDKNKNGVKDSDEEGIAGQVVVFDNEGASITDADGKYYFKTVIGAHRLTTFQNFPYKPIGTNYQKYPNKPLSTSLKINLRSESPSTFDLPYEQFSNNSELELRLSEVFAHPGFNTKIWIEYRNNGATVSNAQIVLDYDSTLVFVHADVEPKSHIGNTLIWNISNIYKTYNNRIEIEFGVPADVTLLGDTLKSNGSISGTNNDFDVSNNTATIQRIITGSYDPNELVAYPCYGKRCVVPMDSSITYTVHFQNEGSDTAFSVSIIDTISQLFDISTFKLIASSHPVEVSFSGREAKFSFNDIRLPDVKTNENESCGFIKFSIAPKAYMLPNSLASNTAGIYFDFNPPIVTNTVNSLYYANVFDDTTEVITSVTIRDTLFAGLSVYVYSPNYFSSYCEIISTSRNVGKIAFHHEDLMPEYLYYQPKAGFAGTDTIVFQNMSYDLGRLPDTTVMIFTIVPFNFEQNIDIPVHLITSVCDNDGMYSPSNKHQIIEDSIYFSGSVVAGCCSKRTAYARYCADTIIISFKYFDGGCTCDCEFGYNFALPVQGNEKTIRYANSSVALEIENSTTSEQIVISPNPSNGIINISSDIAFDIIQIYALDGTLVTEKQYAQTVDLTHLPNGVYRAIFIRNGVTVALSELVLGK